MREGLGGQLHALKHGEPARVLAELRRLRAQETTPAGQAVSAEAREVVASSRAYRAKRREPIRSGAFEAKG